MRTGEDKTFARRLRRESTEAERLLWRHLRGQQLGGYRFRRQVQIGPYYADFACLEARLIVEVDGGQHNGRESDEVRDGYLVAAGFFVFRVWNNEVMENMAGVCEAILARLEARHCTLVPPPQPSPASGGGG